jgi:hypothetical protein
MIHRYMAMATLPFDITRQGLGLIKSAVGRRDEGSDVDALRDELAELKSMIKDMKKDSM